MDAENLNILWSSAIVEELIRNQVTCFCITTGSRSTPLTVAAARNAKAKATIFYDERGAAFYAVGYARASGDPAALICTSGTAVANYYPAIIEASMDHIPIIVLTADRPPELQETGANQTIRQSRIYGDYVHWHFDLPCPDEDISISMVLTAIDQLVYRARRSPSGPAHLNCMFREPLAPVSQTISAGYRKSIESWQEKACPYTTVSRPSSMPDQGTIDRVAHVIMSAERGLLVVGRLGSQEDINAVRLFSQRLRWPVFADIASGLRIGFQDDLLLAYFDLMLLCDKIQQEIQPDVILKIGGRITSKRFMEYLTRYQPLHFIAVENHPERSDPSHSLTWRIESDVGEFLSDLQGRLQSTTESSWSRSLLIRSKGIERIIQDDSDASGTLHEIRIARSVSQTIFDDHGLFLGNSMPIRDMDMFSDSAGRRVRVGTNRGASGIDGNIASAAGFARGLNHPTTLIIGDLAFIHDVNSLSILKRMDQPVIIILINNRGGGIFSFLPIADFKDVIEPYFVTPHDYSFEHAANLFHIPYHRPQDLEAFIRDYQTGLKGQESVIIEASVDRDENKRFHQNLYQKIISFLEAS